LRVRDGREGVDRCGEGAGKDGGDAVAVVLLWCKGGESESLPNKEKRPGDGGTEDEKRQ
jgi:hypothetical protein